MSLKRLFLQCLWLVLGPGVGIAMMSSSTQISPSITSSSTTSSVSMAVPTPEPPLLQRNNLCRTGPQFDNSSWPDIADNGINANRIAVTDHIYLDSSEPAPCSGMITRWHYCYVVFGFHNVSSGLQPCVWRRSNPSDSNAGYEKIGCNEISIIPGERDGLQCQSFAPLSHFDLIRVEEGDYIGFYVPDSGLFLPFSPPEDDTDSFQQKRITTGFAPFIKDSELRNATTQPGRALLSAEIDTSYIFPSATLSSSSYSALTSTPDPVPHTSIIASSRSMIPQIIDSPTAQPTAAIESTSATSAEPVTTTARVATASTVLLTVGVVVPSAIALIVVMVTTLIICVYCKKYLKYKRFHSDTAELLPKLLENPAYSMVSQNHVMIGNQLTLLDCTSNQAYNHAGMVGKLQTVVQVKNQAYNVLSANHVIVGRQQTTVDLSENPAYDPMTRPGMAGQPKSCMKTRDQRPTSIASSAGLRQLEHTYESLSPHYAHPYHELS